MSKTSHAYQALNNFSCVRCGNCCRWPGAVRVSELEIKQIAEFLHIDESEFIANFTTLTQDRRGLTLLENPDGSCLYLTQQDDDLCGCLINPVKPAQCSSFPYKWNFPNWEEECEGAKK